jgi:hypothetical protein
MSPSERLAALHSLNRREEINRGREVSGLAAFIAIGLFIACIFVWATIGVTPHE